MKQYETYKDSGVEWVGEIPKHWEVSKMNFIGSFSSSGIDKKIIEGESLVKIINFTDIYKSKNHVLNSNIDYMIVSSPEEKRTKNLVKKGDLIFLPSSETIEDLGLSALVDENLENTSFSYHVIRFVFSKPFNHSFKKYLTNNNIILNVFSSNGQGTTRQIIGRNVFKNIKIVFPSSLEEQTQIANYLNHKTAQLDTLIAKKEQLINLLQEERTAMINQAVTKGLDPNVPMKDSSIEWLGEIPEHWVVPKIWHLVMMKKLEIQDGNHGSLYPKQKDFKEEGVCFIKPRDIRNGAVNFSTCDCLTPEHAASLRIGFSKPNDILLVNRGGTIGRMARMKSIPKNSDYVLINPQMTYIRCNQGLDSDFTYYQCKSDVFQESLEQVKAFGSTFSFLGLSNMGDFPFIQPPVKEQKDIGQYIIKKESEIDYTISNMKQEIKYLKEYKTALISEVVTGKIDVREEVLN